MFTDFHIDYDYTPGQSVICDKPICCRSNSGRPSDPRMAAGKWNIHSVDCLVLVSSCFHFFDGVHLVVVGVCVL